MDRHGPVASPGDGDQRGVYAFDTFQFGDKWELAGGLRWDRFDADYHQWIAPTSAFDRLANMASWRAAVVYKPVPAAIL